MSKGVKKTGTAKGRINNVNCELGGYVAESETDLAAVYFDNPYFSAAADVEDRRCFYIGRTGVGKSAILKMIEERNPTESVVVLTASEFAFREVELRQFIWELSERGVKLDYVFKSIWKYLLVVALLKKRFPDLKQRLGWLQASLLGLASPGKKAAYDFLLKNEEIHGQRSFSERLAIMLDAAEIQVKAALGEIGNFGSTVSVSLVAKGQSAHQQADRNASDLSSKLKGVVERSWSIAQLQNVVGMLSDEILTGANWWVLIDDLDTAFAESVLAKSFIQCLFDVIVEMQNKVTQLKFVVALRTDIFGQLQFYQREKVSMHVVRMVWTPAQLRTILENRVRFCLQLPEDRSVFGQFFPQKLRQAEGREVDAFEFMRSRTLDRPRDLIAFAAFAMRRCVGETAVGSSALRDAEFEYSRGRLGALVDEWRSVYPYLERALLGLRGKPRQFEGLQLAEYLSDVLCSIVSEQELSGEDLGGCLKSLEVDTDDDVLFVGGASTEVPLAIRRAIGGLVEVGALELRGANDRWQYGPEAASSLELSSARILERGFRVHAMLRAALAQ